MTYRKGSVDRMLIDEYSFMRFEERPRYGTPEWNKWLEEFGARHIVEVSRITESLSQRAVKVLRALAPWGETNS